MSGACLIPPASRAFNRNVSDSLFFFGMEDPYVKKLSLLVVALVAVFGLSLAYVSAEDKRNEKAKDCDLKTIEKGWFCKKDGKMLEKAELKEGKCPVCGEAPADAEICVKLKYHCDKDGVDSEKDKCPKCKAELKGVRVLSRVIFKCDKCGAIGEKAGKCEAKDCKGQMKKTCEQSGTPPHVGH